MNFSRLKILFFVIFPFVAINAQESAIRNQVKNVFRGNESHTLNDYFSKNQNSNSICTKVSSVWNKYQYSTSDEVIIYKNCIDKLGNSFICGNLRDGNAFNGGFVLKHDINGNTTWSSITDADIDEVYNIASDNSNNFIVIGNDDDNNSIIKKYNSNNTLVWKKSFTNCSPLGVVNDNLNNIYIVGYFNGSANFDNININSSSNGDMYICKMNASGNIQWVKNINVDYTTTKYRLDLSVDQSNNLYICSEYEGDISFLGKSIINKGGKDIFVAKIKTDGSLGWVNTIGSAKDDIGISCSVDNSGNVFATGFYTDSIAPYKFYGNYDAFVTKLNSNGSVAWFKSIGGEQYDYGWSCIADNQGGCLVTGSFNDLLLFDNKVISKATDVDGFLINIANNGNLNWIEKISGYGYQRGTNLSFFNSNEYLLSGAFDSEYTIGNDTVKGLGTYTNGYIQKIKINNSVSPNIKQNIVGKWKGILKQDANGDFYYEMDLKYDILTNKVTGTTFISRNEDYALFELEGYTIGECQVYFNELKILKGKGNWCFKQGVLTISADNSNLLLNGDWLATSNCNPGTISVTKISPEIKLDNSTGLDFGSKQINTTNPLSIDIKNTGNVVMIIDSIRFPDGYTGNWTKNAILPNSSQSLTVTFKPLLAKNYDGIIIVYANISQGSNLIPVKGVGITAPAATISLSTAGLDFGEQEVNTKGIRTFEITNIGNLDLNINSITYPSGFTGDYNFGTLKPNEKRKVIVSFNPLNIITYSGKIDIKSNANNGTVQSINCNGKGISNKNIILQLIVNPVLLSGSNKTVQIIGKNLTLNSPVNINILSPNGSTNTIKTNANSFGEIKTNYTLPSITPNGKYQVELKDTVSNKSANGYFTYTNSQDPSLLFKNLIINSPIVNQEYNLPNKITINWTEFISPTRMHPINSAGQRAYSYILETQLKGSSSWITINQKFEGYVDFSQTLNLFHTLALDEGEYSIRVTDTYNSNNQYSVQGIKVNKNPNSQINAKLLWDNSFPVPASDIVGIASDGTSRFYIAISGKNKLIKNLELNLRNDDSDLSNRILGKLKYCKTQNNNQYTEEANDAILTKVSSISPNANGMYWFWYVAPDDFVGFNKINEDKGQREVKLDIKATFDDGSSESSTIIIKIIRPPLMLVHGLGGNTDTWKAFGHMKDNGILKTFYNDNRFPNQSKRAVTLIPNASFERNAKVLLGLEFQNSDDNFVSFIQDLRLKGYVCNQVDYVCHSMGGNIIRTVINSFNDYYYGSSSIPNKFFYKNYGKGYVNKIITIDTPHEGSPWADILKIIVPQLNYKQYVTPRLSITMGSIRKLLEEVYPYDKYSSSFFYAFMKPNSEFFPNYDITDAVKNLQVNVTNGGIDFEETKVKAAHLIAGDIIPSSLPELPAGFRVWFNGIEVFSDYFDKYINYIQAQVEAKVTNDPISNELKSEINNISSITDRVSRVVAFLKYSIKIYDAAEFLFDSDLIVGTKSQMAGLDENINGVTLLGKDSKCKDCFHAAINPVTANVDIGNKVLELLNTPVNTPYFLKVIPKSPNFHKDIVYERNIQNNEATSCQSIDTTKAKIIRPLNNSILFTDSIVTIEALIKDTTNLYRAEIFFQDLNLSNYQIMSNYIWQIPINGKIMGKQQLVLLTTYKIGDNYSYFIDSINVNVMTKSNLVSLELVNKLSNSVKGEIIKPIIKLNYPTFSTYSLNLDNLKITILDTNVANLIQKNIIQTNKKGYTYYIVNYEGLSDTGIIIVKDSVVTTSNSDLNKNSNNNEAKIKIYPNPNNGNFNLIITNCDIENSEIKVYNNLGSQMILEKSLLAKNEDCSLTINISNYSAGVYYLVLSDKNKLYAEKFIKI